MSGTGCQIFSHSDDICSWLLRQKLQAKKTEFHWPQCLSVHCHKTELLLATHQPCGFLSATAVRAQFIGWWYKLIPGIFSSHQLGGRGVLPPEGICTCENTLSFGSGSQPWQRGLETWLLIVLAFFFCEWQSFCSTFCDMKMNTGLKHIFDSSPTILVSQAPHLSLWVCLQGSSVLAAGKPGFYSSRRHCEHFYRDNSKNYLVLFI